MHDQEGIAEQVRSTLDNLLEGAQIIDRDWRYVYLNATAARHGGSTVEQLVGRTMTEAYPGIDQTEMFATLRRVMQSGVPAEMENEFILPDGTTKWFQLMIQPVPSGLFILSLDITDRKRAEIEQRKARARIEAIVESLHEGLVLVDLRGSILHWNRAALAMLGFTNLAEARAAIDNFPKIFRVTTPDGALVSDQQRPLARVLRGETFQDLELCVARIGTTWERVFAYSGGIAHYAEGESLAFVTIRDITQHKELEKQFVRAQRMDSIGNLAGGVAHDLNNVLMPIIMGTTYLRRCELDERAMRTLDDIERSAKRGADLVRQVLSFARGVTAPWVAVDVRDIVAEV
ncbi:MAG TPA: PAS domain-containing protein, partial [Thermoanaerobaculia bacterium]